MIDSRASGSGITESPTPMTRNAEQQLEEMQTDSSPPLPREGLMLKFRLYETRSKFYMVGRNKSRTYWRVLKIDRLELSELNIREDSTTYTERECSDLLRRIHEGNKATGGLKFVTTCYGIVGFIRFLGPYYMLLITKRRQIGVMCGHNIYAISKSEIIPLSYSALRSNMVNDKNENRYKKLLCMVDLTRDFYFSYSYNVMRTLQKNMCDNKAGQVLYETMFVWNEFLTREMRNVLQNTSWTVALVYGFFKQATLPISGREFKLTLMARRSRHYAGTRYLKRGVNEKGRVANDVETEQIIFEDVAEGVPAQISSVVQNRGSIPLFWSQETSRLNLKPDIILSKRDQNYEATRLHFENLVERYGNPIIILNLIKTNENKPRETILRAEFANAIEAINNDLSEEDHLKFIHLDLHKHSRSKATNVLLLLGKAAKDALTRTGFFYCQLTPNWQSDGFLKCHCFGKTGFEKDSIDEIEDLDTSDKKYRFSTNKPAIKSPMSQKGVLRTNCIDCLDRTNVAQYAYGLVALGHQLHALGVSTSTKVDLDDPLAEELMFLYERMGDTLSHQYGGSAAHNKIFSQRRGHWKAAIQSQEFFRTLQRYYNNAYIDADKQNAINVFLGDFRPEPGKPDVWELDCDQHPYAARNIQSNIDENRRLLLTRSWSDGHILHESHSAAPTSNVNKGFSSIELSDKPKGECKLHSKSTREISAFEADVTRSRHIPSVQRDGYLEHENIDTVDFSNFVDLDCLSSGTSCEEELGRSMFSISPSALLSSENFVNEMVVEKTPSNSNCGSNNRGRQQTEGNLSYNEAHDYKVLGEYSNSFAQWIIHGETICH